MWPHTNALFTWLKLNIFCMDKWGQARNNGKGEKGKEGESLANFKAENMLDEMGMVLTVKLLLHFDSPQR